MKTDIALSVPLKLKKSGGPEKSRPFPYPAT